MPLSLSCIHSAAITQPVALPLFLTKISAGFPSPAEDYLDRKLDLNEHLVKHPAATFFLKVDGQSMIKAGIHSGDILIVDRSLEPADKKIVIAGIRGELIWGVVTSVIHPL
jgi:DNA polymerase V